MESQRMRFHNILSNRNIVKDTDVIQAINIQVIIGW